MGDEELDISRLLAWDDGLPRPQWDIIEAWLERRCGPVGRREAWVAAARQWLGELGSALDSGYDVGESEHFLILAPQADAAGQRLLGFAERCRSALLASLGDLADFEAPGKQVVLAFGRADDYYSYIAQYFPEGHHGASGGVHIRAGYPHVAAYGDLPEGTLAHELTHACLHHLSMPQWLEEGLAQILEGDITGQFLLVDGVMAARHKEHWSTHGLDEFWRGEGFSRPGEVQELSYQLAEVLVRLLVEDARPRWFGWVREPHRRFLEFLREADTSDYGQAACRGHLGYELGDLAARFLGPGPWSAGLQTRRGLRLYRHGERSQESG